jgi:hypothetical protein
VDQHLVNPGNRVGSIAVVSRVEVATSVKGSIPGFVEIEHKAHLELGEDGVMRLVVSPQAAPPGKDSTILVFAGEQALSGRYTPLPFKTLLVDDGFVRVHEWDAPMASIDGLAVEDVLQAIRTAMSPEAQQE